MKIEEIEDMGEESGREEAADLFPFLPKVSDLPSNAYTSLRRQLRQRGRGRAQALYELRGRAAKRFATCWAMGYLANCSIFEEDFPEE